MPECSWPGNDAQYRQYHDNCWGMPVVDSQELFAKLCLDGQQAGLSWITILRKQAEYYRLFEQFNPEKIALFDDNKIQQLLQEPGIVRNRLKIKSIVQNAQSYLNLYDQGINFSDYLWSFVNHFPIDHQLVAGKDTPTTTPESLAMAKSLKKQGFKFVGETICYAFMQAVGMVNDHLISCSAHSRCNQRARELFKETI